MKNLNAGSPAIILLFLILLPATVFSTETEWKHLFTRDGIDVFRKTFPGTRVCAFKGVGYVDAEIEVVDSVLQDISAYPQWVARCREAVVLKDIGQDTKVIYNVVDTPLPFKDRDVLLSNKTVYNLENGMVEITFDIFDQGLIPPSDKYYRVSDLSGKYLIERFKQNKTRVTFVYRGNPGGNIPVSIANWLASRRYPYKIIMGLREMAQKQNAPTSIRRNELQYEN